MLRRSDWAVEPVKALSPKTWIILCSLVLFHNNRSGLQLLRGRRIWRAGFGLGGFMAIVASLDFIASLASYGFPNNFISLCSVIVTGLWRHTCV